jgi:hypothetical protein
MAQPELFRTCSTCRKPILFEAEYFLCSVSTCNRKRTGLFFCSVECWDAHLPMMRHREAWAERALAPTREVWEKEQADEAEAERRNREQQERNMDEESEKQQRAGAPGAEVPREVLVVVSKLKNYIKARSGMNTSDGVIPVLSDEIRRLCDRAIDNATRDGRKTVMDRDFAAAARE